ncbi:MAG: alpha/beta hydrolase [Planctomycetota bacterium]
MRIAIPMLAIVFVLLFAASSWAKEPVTHAYVDDAEPRQHLDHYTAESDDPRPVVVFVHGGGWQFGRREVARIFADNFTDAGVDVISVGYRLVPDVKWPVNVEDVAAAVDWIFDNAESLGIDPNRITLMGHSAGAHLIACLGADERWLAAHDRSPADLAGIVLLDGAGYDLIDTLATVGRRGQRLFRRAFGEDETVWRDASPAHNVAENVTGHWLSILADGRQRSADQTRLLFEALPANVEKRTVETTSEDHGQVMRTLADPEDPELAIIIALVSERAIREVR